MSDFAERVVVVTGASSGIGLELAVVLARHGARVALVARRTECLAALQERIQQTGGVAAALPCDLTDPVAVRQLPARVEQALGPADVLVNNAGRGAYGAFTNVDLETHRQLLRTNLEALVDCTYAFLPGMQARGRGQLVFISSVLGRLPAPEHAVYAASKWGVSGLAESLMYELAPLGIGVVLVEPGLVRSEFAVTSSTPLQRFRQAPSKSPAQVAMEVLRSMRQQRPHHIADRIVAIVIAAKRHLPRLFRVLFAVVYRRNRRT